MDDVFQLRQRGLCQSVAVRETAEKHRGHKVNRRIGALGCKNSGRQELERGAIIKEGPVVRVTGTQDGHNLNKAFGFGVFCFKAHSPVYTVGSAERKVVPA